MDNVFGGGPEPRVGCPNLATDQIVAGRRATLGGTTGRRAWARQSTHGGRGWASTLTILTNMTYRVGMNDALIPTTDFSPAKSHLSDVMTQVFHGHQPQLVSRHRGKEQMLLMRPDDLVAMLADQHLEVLVVHDGDEVTLRIPEMGVLGFGGTLDEATEDLLVELRAYAARFFRDAARFMATTRATHAGALLRFALSTEEAQRRMLSEVEETEPVAAPGAAG